MSRVSAVKAIRRKLKVVCNKEIAPKHFLLILETNENIEVKPGQFLQLSLGENVQFLRRPFSIFDYQNENIEILYKLRGKVTHKMATLKKSDVVDVIYPLGNYFPQPDKKNVILISGGTGFAPLHFLAKELIKEKPMLTLKFFIGSKSKEVKAFSEFLPDNIKVELITEDGSVGKKGRVTEFISDINGCIYSAGPIEMLRAIYEKIKSKNSAYFSFESHFACGVGFCWGCVLPTQKGNLRICKEGPIFSPEIVVWERI